MLHVASEHEASAWKRAAFTAFSGGVLEGAGSVSFRQFLTKLGLGERGDTDAAREKALRNAARVAQAFQRGSTTTR